MKILTWNINSVRLRLPLLLEVLAQAKPDVFCLQETKTQDEFFPSVELISAGYEHYYFAGMKSYNGVAIFSKYPLTDKVVHNHCSKEDCRHISVKVDGKFELHNIYIPAGGDIPDVNENEKFKHKLDFIDELNGWYKNNRSSKDKLIAVGDFNIAPFENDVWSHKQLLKIVSHTPIEVEKLLSLCESINWVDVARKFVPMSDKIYSWWSYRSADWNKADKGRRLDHIWVTPVLEDKLQSYSVMREIRGAEKPSDHVPVIVELNI